jgi:hypothetical protein
VTKEALEAWAERVAGARPELYETRRMDRVHANMALGSARTGPSAPRPGRSTTSSRRLGAAGDRLDIA